MAARDEFCSVKAGPEADLLLSPADMAAGFDRLAEKLQPLIDKRDCVLLGVLNGGLYPLVRLADRLRGDFVLDYCHATRYEGQAPGEELTWLKKPSSELAGKTVIIVDDIFDVGITLAAVRNYCQEVAAADAYTAVMLIKDRERGPGVRAPDYDTGLRVPDRYVFGCGMDIDGRWRHLPAVYACRAVGAQRPEDGLE